MSGEHQGGFDEPIAATMAETGETVTVSFGWGTKEGHTLIADGDRTDNPRAFMKSSGHNHYGPGGGPNNNAKDRGQYTGPGA